MISGDPLHSWPRLVCPRVSTFSALLAAAECWWLYLCHSGPKEGDKENIQEAWMEILMKEISMEDGQ